jgi:hypothetical protein
MFWQNLKTIHHACGELLAMDKSKIDDMVANGHAIVDHIATSSDDIEEVYHFEANIEDGEKWWKIKVVKMKVVMKMSMVALKI